MNDDIPAPAYSRHIFFCAKDRGDGRNSCAALGGQALFALCKATVKAAGLGGPGGVRVNQSSCLNRCAEGPVAVVYPQGAWYTFVEDADIDALIGAPLQPAEGVSTVETACDARPG